MDKEYFTILIFGHKTSRTQHLRICKNNLKIGIYLFAFLLLGFILIFCDYIQVKKKAYDMAQLREVTEVQKSQIYLLSSKIEELEKHISRLKEFDKRIRIIANLEKGQEITPFMGIGGPSPSDIREKLKEEKDGYALLHQMKMDIDRLQKEAQSQESSLSELEKLLNTKRNILAHTPSIWPTSGWVTSGFGFRMNPFTGLTQMHEGIDISNQAGTPIIAPADGFVSDTGNDWVNGKTLILSHGFGMVTRYSHLSKISVRPGQKVRRGDKIGEIGMTGKTTGPHLHYEVRINGVPVNPMRYILN